jgi:uncharacterized protein with von Willebrand factor type A (vWA) domain
VKRRLLEFIDQLRTAGVRPSVSESLDAMAAASALGVEREALRAALAATLIKDAADRPTFDALFDRFFALPLRARGKGKPAQPVAEGGGRGQGESGAEGQPRDDTPPSNRGAPHPPYEHRPHVAGRQESATQRAARRRELLDMPFEAMDARAVEAAAELMAELARRMHAHLSRRYRRAPTGRLDFRRTIRASLASGGVPLAPAFRARRPGKLDLIALCDLSHSTATAAEFCLGLLAPAMAFFRRVQLFGYVDRAVEISFEHGHVVPHQPLDLAARSDFGQVLRQLCERWEPLLTRNTLVLILGDARNNRRPPRADLLARIHAQVRRVAWLNPESRARWNTGDSVLDAYVKHCDTMLAAGNLRDLTRALRLAL